MDLTNIKKIYFVGIGGIGMSAVAGIAKAKGFEVSGSDASDIYEPSKGILDQYKIDYTIGYAAENFNGADLVVATPAVDQSNPEIAKALEMNIPIIGFAELLGALTTDKKRIVVVGTHGKGTTSGLISYALKNLEDSGFFVGAVLTDLNTNFYFGTGPNFVIEGDEYKSAYNNNAAKFLYYNPNVLLINNIEFDHPDLYPTLEDFKKPFAELVSKMPADGIIVYNADDKNVLEVVKDSPLKKIGFLLDATKGIDSSVDVVGELPRNIGEGVFHFDITTERDWFKGGKYISGINTKLPGNVYAQDVLAAATVLLALGYSVEDFGKYVSEYSGVKRRYQVIKDDEIAIIDDYADHPTAVQQTLEATRLKYPGRRIICFFEPHTYSRTRETLDQLEKAFNAADLVYLAEVYPAREQKLPSSVTGQEVTERIAQYQPNVVYVKDKEEALNKFKDKVQKGDVIVVMAVGSFNTLVYDLKEAYEQHSK